VAGWVARTSLYDTGNDKERQYKVYADAHWDWGRYRDPNSGPCTPDGHSDGGIQDSTLVFLYETRRNDFYEDIGKLSIYSCGWDSPANREIYQGMRDDSYDFLRRGRTATMIIFLNHLASAVHAARGATAHNRRLAGNLEVDVELTASLVNPRARVALSRRF
jgi:hypothetical protein